MTRISGSFIIFIIGITAFALVFTGNVFNRQYKLTEDNYKYALVAATRDATAVMVEVKAQDAVNLGYEGYAVDNKNIVIDYKGVLERFYNTLWYNLGLYGDTSAQNAFKMHIPIKGVVGNQAVYVALWNDTWLPPKPYTYFDKDRKIIYNYTLGDDVWYYDTVTGAQGWKKVADVQPPSPVNFTPKSWKQYIIMETINQTFTEVASSELNMNAYNQGKGIGFMLPHGQNDTQNIIDHPGVFALLDGVMIGFKNEPLRTFSFAGAQLMGK